METEENLNLFDQYLSGQLSGEELEDFEYKLKTNLPFKNEFEKYKALIHDIDLAFFKNDLENIHTQTQPTKTVFLNTKLWWAAASIFIVGLIAFYWIQQNNTPSLYATYFKKDPGLPTLMGVTDQLPFQQAMVLYKQGKYKEARSGWKEMLKAYPQNDTLNYYWAMSYLNENKTDSALYYLDKKSVRESPKFRNDALYYKTLISVKNKDYYKALSYIDSLPPTREVESLKKALLKMKK